MLPLEFNRSIRREPTHMLAVYSIAVVPVRMILTLETVMSLINLVHYLAVLLDLQRLVVVLGVLRLLLTTQT